MTGIERRLTAVGALVGMMAAAGLAPLPARADAYAGMTPHAIIAEIYRRMIADNAYVNPRNLPPRYTPPESIYSPRLTALVAAARKAANGEAACGLDFVFWVNGQDSDVTHVDVGPDVAAGAGRETVTASFANIGTPMKIVFDFQKIRGRWKLDDAQSIGGGERWLWSKVLQCKS
ncbi:MAG TPA: hypothetical protein VKU90_04380 [Caulobacteraceae bacterium]|nr:hypothetical protein [Caulobacteraceae bacterium]